MRSGSVWIGVVLGAVAGLGGATPLGAGAWPREPGSWFLSLGYELSTTRAALSADGQAEDPTPDLVGYATLYAEYGLTPRLTLGFDIGADEQTVTAYLDDRLGAAVAPDLTEDPDRFDADPAPGQSVVVFLRRALAAPQDVHQVALQLGAGFRRFEDPGPFFGAEEMRQEIILKPAAAWGRGFDGPLGPGWLSVETSVEIRTETSGTPVKLDATAGFRRSARRSWLLQVQTGDFPGSEPFAKILPGAVHRLGERASLETSLIFGVAGIDTVGTKIGLWLTF